MGFLKEFKEFAVKGNMMDMAIGIIIGASFNKVIDVLVQKVLLPPLSLMSNSVNLQNKELVLREGVFGSSGNVLVERVVIGYGELIEVTLDFLLIGLTVFIVVKFMNRLRNRSQDIKDTSIETPKEIQLLTNLTELIQEQNDLLRSKVK